MESWSGQSMACCVEKRHFSPWRHTKMVLSRISPGTLKSGQMSHSLFHASFSRPYSTVQSMQLLSNLPGGQIPVDPAAVATPIPPAQPPGDEDSAFLFLDPILADAHPQPKS